jgi:farnesyl diphosphate synthase
MAAVAEATERELDRLLPPPEGPLGRLGEAMRYATLGGGKRFRPLLVAATAALGRAEPEAVTRVGAAIELLHAYSLIHDDLPAMDDATLRRGKPACHIAFGEGEAILAGDALLTLAFEALARGDWPAAPALRCELALGLARAGGWGGMCGGQLLDLADEGSAAGLDRIAYVEGLKTGAIIAFACDAGALLAGLDRQARGAIAAYAADLGLAYQISDDLLDAEGDAAVTGKDSGIDAAADKATFVRALGVDGARRRLGDLRAHGKAQLDFCGSKGTLLRELFDFVINRRV